MNIFQALFLGVIEGLTEFLPVSSTFHLIWASHFIGLPDTEFLKAFEVIIQSGAILAVTTLYFSAVIKNKKLIQNLIFSFIPTAVIGFVLYKIIKDTFFEEQLLQIVVFTLVGVLFLIFEKSPYSKRLHKNATDLTKTEAVIVGLAQALAVFPGVSRAGAVMLSLMFLKVERAEAAKYSFLLAVPTLVSAAALDILKSKDALFSSSHNIPLLVAGTAMSFVSALFVVKWFINYLQRKDLTSFGWYRVLAGAVLFIIR